MNILLLLKCDRLAADMAVELRDFNVASISLWPGAVRTELFTQCDLLSNDRVGFAFFNAKTVGVLFNFVIIKAVLNLELRILRQIIGFF